MSFASLWPGFAVVAKRNLSNLTAHPDSAKHALFVRGDGVLAALSGVVDAGRVDVPANSTATGTAGTWAEDADYHYRCVATDTWRRIALMDW